MYVRLEFHNINRHIEVGSNFSALMLRDGWTIIKNHLKDIIPSNMKPKIHFFH